MIHGPCGDLNPNSPCMQEYVNKVTGVKYKKCSKGYPKDFQEETIVDVDGKAYYARPNNGRTINIGEFFLDNQWVVPYSAYLLKRFGCHTNFEKVKSLDSVKYLKKYLNKGSSN